MKKKTLLNAVATGLLVAGLAGLQPLAATAAAPSATATAVTATVTAGTSQFAENRSLSASAVSARMAKIQVKYTTVGQVLSATDAEFIKIYAKGGTSPSPSITGSIAPKPGMMTTQGTSTQTIQTTGSGAGASGGVTGRHSLTTVDFTINNSYSANYTARGTGTVNKIKACTHVRSYGAVGQGGVGVVYSDDPCSTVAGKLNNFVRSKSYQAFVAYSTIQYDITFYTPTGSFQLAG